jgi:hypothetical protein
MGFPAAWGGGTHVGHSRIPLAFSSWALWTGEGGGGGGFASNPDSRAMGYIAGYIPG